MIDFKLIDDSEELNLQLLDDNEEIKLEMTDYDDTEVKEMIDEVDNKVDNLSSQVNHEINEIEADLNELDGRVRINTNNISNLQQTKADKTQVNALSNRVDQIPIVTKTSQLTNDSGFITKDVNNLTYYTTTANLSRVALTGNYNDLTNKPNLSNFATTAELGNETTARENADIGLQGQIDAITSSSDVKDIVGTYTELQNYDTSTLGNDDIIKVLQDSTHNEAMTYYRWVISGSSGSWQYVGQEGPYYTKSETETLLSAKQNEITSSNKLDSDLVDDTNQTNKFVTENEKTTWNNKLDSSDLTNYVKNTDYATNSVGGTIKYTANYATYVNPNNGFLSAETKTYAQYDSGSNSTFISKGTLENVITGKNLVNDTDYANKSTGGVIKIDTSYNGVNVGSSGFLFPSSINYETYTSKENNYFIGKGTLENVLTGRQYLVPQDIVGKQNIEDNSLTTTNKTIPTAINEVNSIAKGANQALSYANYSAMVIAFNSLDDDEYNVGQNVYVVTTEVPDLWVSSVESTSSTYTYVDDATIVSELETNGYIQVGYYKLSMLETQKVDLTNYVKNTDYATSSKAGVLKIDNGLGTGVSPYGVLVGTSKTYAQYNNAYNDIFISKGTLENAITGKGLNLKQLSTYDDTKTQVLKNINGTLTWVNES
jgi:hypothetical protein